MHQSFVALLQKRHSKENVTLANMRCRQF